jgi:hypothetical protein
MKKVFTLILCTILVASLPQGYVSAKKTPKKKKGKTEQVDKDTVKKVTDYEKLMKEKPSFIDGVITGPNAAFPLDILRRYLPSEYPIRLYPDITHNVRCEYPVQSPI